MYEVVKVDRKEFALCIFAFISETYLIAEEYVQPAVFQRFTTILSKLNDELSRPSFFTDSQYQEYFSLLANLVTRSP
jgi:hypothetical protein